VKTKQNLANVFIFDVFRPRRIRLALAGLLFLGLAAGVPHAWAQAPQSDLGASKMPEKSYMAKSALYLPVLVDDRARSGLREILLYVKEGPNGPWLLKQKAPPSQTGFEYRLPQDGEYWFNVVTIDQTGKATPADVATEPPAVIVVLDTCGPQVDLKPLPQGTGCADGICVRCEVHDANPNPFQTRFEYQTGDHVWRSLEPMPNQTDCFCIPRQAVLTGMVKVSCADRALNTTVREFNLTALGLTTTPSDVAEAPAKTVVQTVAHFEQATAVAPQQSPCAGAPCCKTEEAGKAAVTTPSKPQNLNVDCAAAKASVPANSPAQAPKTHANLARQVKHPQAKWLMVNQPHVSLEYKIEDEGKSGVGKVEVWITEDHGKSWEALCDNPDKKSPVAFSLPHEGVFGLRLVVTNGRGFGGNPPKAGDAPQYVVELDMTKPNAELRSAKMGPPDENACIDIVWQADDKNLGSTPIDLFYSASSQGPWTPIAKSVANTGKYRWYLPQELCRQAYVALVVTDMAGNSTRCEISEPIALDDLSRPRAVISGIVPLPPTAAPTGN